MNPRNRPFLQRRSFAQADRAVLPWVLLLAGCLGATMTPCVADTGTQREYELKAGVLYHIIEYVEWPNDSLPTNPPAIQIGLLGQIPFAEAIEVLEGKTIQGRKLVVKRLAGANESAACHVLFIGASEKPRIPEIVAGIKNQPILTVSEVDGFAEQGGMVNLVAGQNRIVMEINREAAGQARLSMSAQLLKLAKVFPR